MQNKLLLFAFSFVFCLAARADLDVDVVEQLNSVNSALKTAGSIESKWICANQTQDIVSSICPRFLKEELKDNDKGGLVGFANKLGHYVFGQSDFSTPNAVCRFEPNFNELKKIKDKLRAFNREIAYDCEESLIKQYRNSAERERARDYAYSSLLDKMHRIRSNSLTLLQSRHQINLLLEESVPKLNCHSLEDKQVSSKCLELSKCEKFSQNLFQQKIQSLLEGLKTLWQLNQEKKKANKDQAAILESAKVALLEANPILKSKELNALQKKSGDKLTLEIVGRALKKDLQEAHKVVEAELLEANKSFECINGKNNRCQNFDETIKKNFGSYQIQNSGTSGYYQCVEMMKESRDEANHVLNDVALSAALSFTPGALIQAGKMVKTVGTILKNTSALKIGVLLDSGYAANEMVKIKSACDEKLKIQNRPQVELNCSSELERISLQKEMEMCTSQLISAGLSSLGPGLGLATIKLSGPSKLASQHLNEIEGELLGIKDITKRDLVRKNLGHNIEQLLKAKENYTSDEISSAIKLMIKRCH